MKIKALSYMVPAGWLFLTIETDEGTTGWEEYIIEWN